MLLRHAPIRSMVSLRHFACAAEPAAVAAAAAAPAGRRPAAPVGPPPEFELLPPEPPVFPELLAPGARALLLAVDPDVNGALAVLRWRNPPPGGGGAGGAAAAGGAPLALCRGGADVELLDMPVETWRLGARDKRQPSAAGLAALVRRCLELDAGAGGAARGAAPLVARAVVEYTTPQALSGKHAWHGIGFSTGVLAGVCAAAALPAQRANAAAWKRAMGLFRLGKPGSMALARALFPGLAAAALARKKDHGRAEALLIAAWALGVRARPVAAAVEGEGSGGESDEGSDAGEGSDAA